MTTHQIEYRVRPITRYVVTRYEATSDGSSVETRGEYENATGAYEVGYALCKAEHDRLGWQPGDERIQYPKRDADAVIASSDGTAQSSSNASGRFNPPDRRNQTSGY